MWLTISHVSVSSICLMLLLPKFLIKIKNLISVLSSRANEISVINTNSKIKQNNSKIISNAGQLNQDIKILKL